MDEPDGDGEAYGAEEDDVGFHCLPPSSGRAPITQLDATVQKWAKLIDHRDKRFNLLAIHIRVRPLAIFDVPEDLLGECSLFFEEPVVGRSDIIHFLWLRLLFSVVEAPYAPRSQG